MSENLPKALVASFSISTTTNRVNEDAATHFSDKVNYYIAVADGIGTSSHAKEASEFVVTQYQKILHESEEDNNTYQTIQNLLQNTFTSEEDSYETTLITLYQNNLHQFIINYAGNGCILHLKGNFWHQKTPSHIPFNLVNLLSPHTLLENGKEVLYNYFSNKKDMDISTSELTISSDPFFGDIFIIATDGFYSEDQKKVGKNKSGIWQQVPQLLSTFFDELSKIFVENKQLSEEMISDFLEGFLNEMKNQLQLEDDTSIGVLISDIALKYHRKQTIMD